MGGFLAVIGLVSAGFSAYNQYKQGQIEEATIKATGEYNAKVIEQQAELTEQAMEVETERSRDDARRLKASQRAAFSKSGARVDVGTPMMVMAEQASDMERDILQQRRNRMIELRGLKSQATMTRFESSRDAKQAGHAGKVGAVSTLLGGAAKAGSIYAGGRSTTGQSLTAGMPRNRSYGAA
jgi:hypothetical protein